MKFLLKEIQSKQKQIKLNVKDKKILQLLIQNGRASITELSKKTGMSKAGVVQKIDSLTKKEIIVGNVTYTNVNLAVNKDLYLYEIQTYVSMNDSKVNDRLNEIKGVGAVLWYNGPFNLIIMSTGRNPQEIIEEVDEIVQINKYRYSKCIGNWFHPPHLFDEIKDVSVEFKRENPPADEIDERIIKSLENNPRATIVEISEKSKISVETAKKRLKKLIEDKSILNFSTYPNLWKLGFDIISVSLVVKGLKNTEKLISKLLRLPQTGNIWEFAHEWNINVVFWVKNQSEVSQILSNLYKECFGIVDVEVMVLAGMQGKY